MRTLAPLIAARLAGLLVALPHAAAAAVLSHLGGTVTGGDGKPAAGAMVTVMDASYATTSTVYADARGKFNLLTPIRGVAFLRVRHPAWKDFRVERLRLSPDRVVATAVQLSPFGTEDEWSDSLPASTHLAQVSFRSEPLKAEFVSQCTFCHQFGNALTRRRREEGEWHLIVNRMEGMGAMLSWPGRGGIPRILAREHARWPLKRGSVPAPPPLDPEAASAQIREWTVAEPLSFLHDLEAHSNGRLYAVDMSYDRIYELDPGSGAIRQWQLPPSALPLGGMFSAAINPFGTFGARYGPHSIVEEPGTGLLWFTCSLSAQLGSFDARTGAFRFFDVPEGAVYPHTIRFDRKGRLWFTVAVSNQVGRFDPKTGEFRMARLPGNGVVPWFTGRFAKRVLKLASAAPRSNFQLMLSPHYLPGGGFRVLNLPYGIDIHPVDGSVWYSKLNAGYVGRVDPESLDVDEIKTPLTGPRRLRFDSTGALWIPSFFESGLMRLDPKTREFKSYKLPTLGPSEAEMPYALAVHPASGEVWITGGASDRLIRFLPKQERFVSYPLPTRVTFMRDIVFPQDGSACTTYSNLPAHAIEGGRPKFACLEP